jgi:phosphoribosyl 1,2-cyclic phosphodiesterase
MDIKTIASSSAGCCYVVESNGEQLLIECGVSLKKIREALNFDLSRVVGCLVSHKHNDHSKSWVEIAHNTAIPLHVPSRLAQEGTRMVDNKTVASYGFEFKIMPVSLEHDVECYGFIVKSRDDILFYATDTGSVNYTIKGLTHLMIEANYSFDILLGSGSHDSVRARVSENHLSIDQAIEFAARHKDTLKEVHLLHLSDAHSNEEQFLEMAQKTLGVPVYVANK